MLYLLKYKNIRVKIKSKLYTFFIGLNMPQTSYFGKNILYSLLKKKKTIQILSYIITVVRIMCVL